MAAAIPHVRVAPSARRKRYASVQAVAPRAMAAWMPLTTRSRSSAWSRSYHQAAERPAGVRRVPEAAVLRLAPHESIGEQIPVPDRVTGGLGREPVALFATAELLLGPLSVGDVLHRDVEPVQRAGLIGDGGDGARRPTPFRRHPGAGASPRCSWRIPRPGGGGSPRGRPPDRRDASSARPGSPRALPDVVPSELGQGRD